MRLLKISLKSSNLVNLASCIVLQFVIILYMNENANNQISIKQINLTVINSTILLILSLVAFIIYVYFTNQNIFIDNEIRDQINLTVLICGIVFFIVGYLLCIFQTVIIRQFTKTAYLNLIPFFFSVPAIIFCISKTRELKNSKAI